MKRKLTANDVTAAVMGGAILGGGGGGLIRDGERMARRALEVGAPELWSVDEFDPRDFSATVALVGAPSAPDQQVAPEDYARALELLRGAQPKDQRIVGINTNENGAATTVNGWLQAALTGLPVLDLACNGRAHPSSLMGALGLHLEPDYVSVQAFAGGPPGRHVEGTLRGTLANVGSLVRSASVEAGGMVAVARNPVAIDYAIRHGAPRAIGHAIEVGRAWIEGGAAGAARALGGRIVAEGTVADYRCAQRGGLDEGSLTLDDAERTTLRFVNEYMLRTSAGARVTVFPDLMMTFDGADAPIVSAEIRTGMSIKILEAPSRNLILSRTMSMPDLYRPFEALLGESLTDAIPAT